MTAGRVRTVFLGSGTFGRESLWRLDAHPDVDPVGVVTAPPRPAGRGGRPRRTPVHDAANELAVPVILTPERLREPDAVATILGLAPGLIVLADYGQIVPAVLLDVPHGALNLHPSLLPRHRGATPIPATILSGDKTTGVSLIRMDEGLDTGPIVAQSRVELDGHETTPALEEQLEQVAADLLEASLAGWLRGDLAATPQPAEGATLTRPFRREDGWLDVTRSAGDLDRQVRALQPWPGSFIETTFGRLVLWSAAPERPPGPPQPHGLVDVIGLWVGAGERLRLGDVQPAGGRRMPWADYVRGRPSIVGVRAQDPPG